MSSASARRWFALACSEAESDARGSQRLVTVASRCFELLARSFCIVWARRSLPPENLPLTVCQRRGDDRAKCDGITELSQSLSQLLSTAFSGLGIGFIALFDVADAVMKNLPGEFPQPMGNQPDVPFVPKPR